MMTWADIQLFNRENNNVFKITISVTVGDVGICTIERVTGFTEDMKDRTNEISHYLVDIPKKDFELHLRGPLQ